MEVWLTQIRLVGFVETMLVPSHFAQNSEYFLLKGAVVNLFTRIAFQLFLKFQNLMVVHCFELTFCICLRMVHGFEFVFFISIYVFPREFPFPMFQMFRFVIGI